MFEPCLFEILNMPDNDLARVFSRASTRSLIYLVSAYPRAAGKSFLHILSRSFSAPTLAFFNEELQSARLPTYDQIRDAEQELVRIIREEQLSIPEDRLAA